MSSTRNRREYYVYIMSSARHTIYTGMTNDLPRRVQEHKDGLASAFTRKYGCTMLVYFEVAGDVRDAIDREKQIKAWARAKRTALIREFNPDWQDLSVELELLGESGRVPDPSQARDDTNISVVSNGLRVPAAE